MDHHSTEPASAETTEAPSGDQVAALLDDAEGMTQLAPSSLGLFTVRAIRLARAEPSPAWIRRLDVLRRYVLIAGERELLAKTLRGRFDVAMSIDAVEAAVESATRLRGVHQLQDAPSEAHQATLLLASAHAHAGDPATAEQVLLTALQQAQGLEKRVDLETATTAAVETMLRLGQLLWHQERVTEAEEWFTGVLTLTVEGPARDALEHKINLTRSR